MTNASKRPRYVAALTSDAISERAEISALTDLEAIETATTWATRIMAHREIGSGTLQVTRDGVEIKSLPMVRLQMGEAPNARRT
jgi:hypothetical protein